ncbi:MAG: serpin family protein [Prevotellaceae bacterium]|jgi:serpin B|nr:serpin family protein [Prevotellaceae bacterium]
MQSVSKYFAALGTLLMLILPTACQNNENETEQPKERVDIVLTRTEQGLMDASTHFAFNFFRQVNASETPKTNFFVSPLSVSLCLSMVANGADGNTLAEMLNALGFYADTYTIDDMNSYHKKLVDALLDLDNTTRLAIANSIWLKEGFDVYDDFIHVNKQMYRAQVSELDFNSPDAVGTINRWCADNTNGLIKKVLQEISENARMYLINALYFKGIWKHQFKKSDTREEPFTNADGTQSTVNMMHQANDFTYYADDDLTMVNLPYGNGAFSMVVMLPEKGRSLDECIAALDAERWNEARFFSHPVDLKLPRFKLEYEKELNEDMRALGMKEAFDPLKADFSKMAAQPLFLNILKQLTYVNVDEEGTEAAAVTVAGVGVTSVGPGEPVQFYADRPFAFFIKEYSTGAILFMGKVTTL